MKLNILCDVVAVVVFEKETNNNSNAAAAYIRYFANSGCDLFLKPFRRTQQTHSHTHTYARQMNAKCKFRDSSGLFFSIGINKIQIYVCVYVSRLVTNCKPPSENLLN